MKATEGREKSVIQNAPVYCLKQLQGLSIWNLSLAADSLTIQIGEKIDIYIVALGITRKVGLFGLHVHCQWSLYRGKSLILSRNTLSSDFKKDSETILSVSELLLKNKSVCTICNYSLGSFEVVFGKFLLKVNNDVKSGEESWRILDNSNSFHHKYRARSLPSQER